MTAPMTAERLAEIEARANAATPGPWYAAHRGVMAEGVEIVDDCAVAGWDVYPENQAFISAARADVPALVAEVRRLTAALEIARREGAEAMRREGVAACERVAAQHQRMREGHHPYVADATRQWVEGIEKGADLCACFLRTLPLDAPGGES